VVSAAVLGPWPSQRVKEDPAARGALIEIDLVVADRTSGVWIYKGCRLPERSAFREYLRPRTAEVSGQVNWRKAALDVPERDWFIALTTLRHLPTLKRKNAVGAP
jgi:hypothetical protein